MLIWRVANEAGEGAYSIYDNEGLRILFTPCSDRHPSPWFDSILDWNGGWDSDWEDRLFGFASEEALHEWFSPDMLDQLAGHAQIRVFDAQVYKLGEKQCVFDPARAVQISVREI